MIRFETVLATKNRTLEDVKSGYIGYVWKVCNHFVDSNPTKNDCKTSPFL